MLTALVLLAACQGDTTAPIADASGSPAPSTVLQISPISVTIETDQRVQFRGQSRNWRGDLIPIPVTWIATGGSIGADGIFSSGITGTFKISGRGRHGRQADSSTVVVVAPASDLVRIKVRPATAKVHAGAQRAFAVTGYRGDGSASAVGVTWSATGGEVDPSGVYTAGTTAGTYQVIAANTAGTLADTSVVTVADAPAPPANPPANPPPAPTLAGVIVLPVSVSLTSGGSAQFKAYGRSSVGDSLPVGVVFTGSGGSITSNGLYTAGPTAGTYRVIATASGLSDTAVVTLTPPSAPPPPPSASGVGIPFGPASLWQTSVNRLEPVGTGSFSASIVGTSADRIVGLLGAAEPPTSGWCST